MSDQLAMSLEQDNSFSLIEGNGSYNHAGLILASEHVDVVLAAVNGNKFPRGLKGVINHGRDRKVLVTGSCSKDALLEYIGVGVRGYLGHDITPALLKKALQVVHFGEVWFDRRTSSHITEAYSGRVPDDRSEEIIRRLSAREKEVLQVLSKGYRNRDIADYLQISPQTIKVHLSSIYEKLGVADRLSAVLLLKQSMDDK